MFLLAQLESDSPRIPRNAPVVFHSDSRYAVDTIRRGIKGTDNFFIRDFMMHLWKKTKILYDIHFVWVRGHSVDVGSELADQQAAEGAQEDEDACMGRWRPTDWGFEVCRRN